jgi:hypothetical protein
MSEIHDPPASGKGKVSTDTTSQGSVYFVQAGEGGPIKIGWTGGDPKARMRDLQTGNPYPLSMLGHVPGSGADEAELHDRFRHLRMVGEWFKPAPEIVAFLAGAKWSRDLPTSREIIAEDPPSDIDPAPKLDCAMCEERRREARSVRAWEQKVIAAGRTAFLGGYCSNGLRAESAASLKGLKDALQAVGYSRGAAPDNHTMSLVQRVIDAIMECPR